MPLKPLLWCTTLGAVATRTGSGGEADLSALYLASGTVGRSMNAPFGAAGVLIAACPLFDAAVALATPTGADAAAELANAAAYTAAARPTTATAADSLYLFMKPPDDMVCPPTKIAPQPGQTHPVMS